MARRFSDEQTRQFVKQYKENRKKGFSDYKNNSAGGYAGDATGTRLHALTLDSPKQKRIVKEFDNSNIYVGPGKSWRDQDTGAVTEPVVYPSDNEIPELKTSSKNMRDQGYYSSMGNRQLDFNYLINNDNVWKRGNALDAMYGVNNTLEGRLSEDLTARQKGERRGSFLDEFFPYLNFGSTDEAAENKAYYDRFGMSKDQVLDQYEKYLEEREKAQREAHPFLTGSLDAVTSPTRSLAGAAGGLSELAFPGSDLSKMLNSDLVQHEVQDVQRKRDYVYESDKLSNGTKTASKIINKASDVVADLITTQAISSIITGAAAANSAADAANTAKAFVETEEFANAPQIAQLLEQGANLGDLKTLANAYINSGNFANVVATELPKYAKYFKPVAQGVLGYGNAVQEKRHELEKAGVDPQTAYERAQQTGLVSGLTSGIMASDAFLANAGKTAITKALIAGGKSAALMGGGQTAEEIADALIMGNQAQYKQEIQTYVAQGMTEEEAAQKAALNILGRVGGAGLGGFAGGAGMSLLGSALNGEFNRIPEVEDDLNEFYSWDSGRPALVDDLTYDIEGATYPAIPGNIPNRNVIQLPDTSSGPPIIMPNTGSGPVIQLPDLSAPATTQSSLESMLNAPENIGKRVRTPRHLVIPEKLQGEELAEAQQRYDAVRKELSARRAQVNTMKQLKQTKDIKSKIAAENKLIKQLDQERKELDRKIKGQPKPIKELLNKMDYNDLFNGFKYDNTPFGVDNAINFTVKYAGDTPEAKALSKELKGLLRDFVEAGDINLLNGLYDKASELDALASSVNAELNGSQMYPYYEDAFAGTSLQERILLSKALGRAFNMANERREAMAAYAASQPAPMEVPNEVPVLTEPAQAVSAQDVVPALPEEVDPNNVIYHAGTLSRYNKADTAGKMASDRSTGYYGTGYYFVDQGNKGDIGKGTSYGNKPYTSVDITKNGKLFKADTDKKAIALHDFSKQLMRYVNGTKSFADYDGLVDELSKRNYLLDLYSEYLDLFEEDRIYSLSEFIDRLEELKNEYEYDAENRYDSAFTEFMKEHGFNGVDTRGTHYANTTYGTVIYDLDENSVLQSHVTDEAGKAGLMNTKIDTGNPVFDPEMDARLKASYEGSIRHKAVRKEYLKLYDEQKLKSLKAQVADKEDEIDNIVNNIIPREKELAEHGDLYEEVMDQRYLAAKREYPDLTREEFDEFENSFDEYDGKTAVQYYTDKVKDHKKELTKLKKRLAAEEKKSKEAYKKAEAIVDGKETEEIVAEDIETLEDEADLAPIEDDVIDEDITPEIETRPAVTRDYSPEEQAKLNDYLARRDELNARVTDATKHLLTTDPQELTNLFAEIDAVNAEMQKDFPEMFENGKYIGAKAQPIPQEDVDTAVAESVQEELNNQLPELNEPEQPVTNVYSPTLEESLQEVNTRISNLETVRRELQEANADVNLDNIDTALADLNKRRNEILAGIEKRDAIPDVHEQAEEAMKRNIGKKRPYVGPSTEAVIKQQEEHPILNDAETAELQQEIDANDRAQRNAQRYSDANASLERGERSTVNTAQPENAVPNLEQPAVDEGKSYYLRLLGDDAFLAEQARINGTTPAELRALASYNLGYGDLPDLQGPPNVPPTPEPEEAPKQKTSAYYKSTMRNTETNQDMSDKEYAERFPRSNYSYTPVSNKKSVSDAQDLIKNLGGIEKATKTLGNPAYFEGREFTSVHLDALETLADIAERHAMSLEEQGLNSLEAWRDANRLHQMAKRGLSNSGQAMQAAQKWKKPSPRAQIDRLASEINAEIDKKKTKGYTNMVNDLSNAVEDAILKGGSTDEIIERVRQVFEANGQKSSYNTKKVAEKVVRYIRNAENNPDLVEEVAKIVKSNMGVSTMTYQEEIAIAELLEQAGQYQPGTRAYDVLVAQAMAMFDETLPPDSLGAKARSIIYDNMLASIRTMFTRNMGGNVGNALIDTLERPLMVGADVIASKFTGNRTRTLSGRAIVEGLYGFKKGLAEWGGDIKEGVNTGRSGQKDLKTVLAQNHNVFRTNSNNKVVKGSNIVFHVYDRLVRKGMELGDRPIYEMRYAQTKAELLDVVDRFGDEGLRKGLGIEGAQDMDTNDLIEFIATGEALEAVLQNDSGLKNAAKSLKKFFKDSSEGILGVDVASMSMAPFVEVPANMADIMFQHTPIGAVGNIVKSVREKKKYGSVNQRRMTKEAGRNIGGALLTAGSIALAAKGLTSGPLSGDKDEKKVQQNNGFQEYAVQNKEGTTQVDISDIPIAGPMVQYGKRLYDAYQDNGVTGALEESIPALSAVAVDQLYQSLNRLTGGTQNASTTKGNFIGNTIDSLIAGATSMAVPSVVRQTAQYLDPYTRDLGDYGTKEYYQNLFINGIPILRENMLEPKVDTSGNYVPELGGKEGIQRFLAAYATPWKVSHPYENMSDVQKYAMELNLASDGEVNPQTPVFNKNDLVSTKGFDAENYTHAQLREADEDFYKANAELGSLLINQSWFRELSPELQGKYLDKLFSANKENTKYNAVRKGKTEAEIKALGDNLYQTDKNALSTVIRSDNDAHTKMLMWIKDQAEVDALNAKYGTDIGRSTYAQKENEKQGGGEAWIRDSVPAHELGYNTDDYQRYEATYPGGAKQRKADETEAQKHSLTLDQYNTLKSKAGQNFDAALSAADELRRRGFDNYKVGRDYTRSDFPMDECVDLYRKVDTNYNQQLTQSEIVDYLNANNIGDELAQRIWAIGGFKKQDGTDKPLTKSKKGKWKY